MNMLRYLGVILSLYATLDAKSSILDAFIQDKTAQKTQPGYYYPNYTIKSDTEKKEKYDALMKGPKVPGYTFFSQTEMHLAKHFYEKPDLKTNDQQVINMCHRLIERELAEQKKGRYTLLHAQPWALELPEMLYTQLWRKIHNVQFDNYIFSRFRSCRLTEKDLNEHIKIRNHMLANGVHISYQKSGEYAMCVNFGLFCNYGATNSFYYFLNNSSCWAVPAKLNVEHVFKVLKLSKYYNQFQAELIDLENEHKSLSTYGHILLYSLTPEMLERTVYPTCGGYGKADLTHYGISHSSMQNLFDNLRSDPWKQHMDNYHFCLITGKDCGLIPNNGLDVYEFNGIEPNTYAAFETKRKALLDKIFLNIDFDLSKKVNQTKKTLEAIVAKVLLWQKHGCILSNNNIWNQYLTQQLKLAN